jgi:hypothetical protein
LSTEDVIAFKGEAMLLNWSESKHGRTVVFLLDEESDQHPMKKFTTKRGETCRDKIRLSPS